MHGCVDDKHSSHAPVNKVSDTERKMEQNVVFTWLYLKSQSLRRVKAKKNWIIRFKQKQPFADVLQNKCS